MTNDSHDKSDEQNPYDQPPEHKAQSDPYGNPLAGRKPKQAQGTQQRYVKVTFPGAITTPYITYALLAINALIFSFYIIDFQTYLRMVDFGVMDVQRVTQYREIYRLFTAMFLHGDEAHILFNGLAIYYIGANVERIFGHWRYLLIYILGGLTGSVISILLNEGGLGASGAVFAIFGAETYFFYSHRKLFGEAGMARVRRSAIIIGLNFLFGIIANTVNTATGQGSLIGNFAHLGGLLGGVIMAWLAAPRFITEKVENPQLGENPIRIKEVNPLHEKLPQLLYYCAGLAAILLLAIMIRT